MSDVIDNENHRSIQSSDVAKADVTKARLSYMDTFPTSAEIDSWATRLGALAILSFLEVRESGYSGYYQAALVYAGVFLTVFALFPMLKHIWRFVSGIHSGRALTALLAVGCFISVMFILVTLIISAFLVNHLYLNSPLPGWLP